ncbi:GNAT family N-acetyltransferase, partial [Chloroflexota bacterium]
MPIIRAATEDDIPHILKLYRQLAMDKTPSGLSDIHNIDEYRQAFTKIQKFTGYQLLIAEDQGEILGTMVLLIVPNLSHHASPWAVIENMVVAERY